MKLYTRHLKLGKELKEKIDNSSLPNSEIIRRVCRQIKSNKINPSKLKVKMDTPITTIDCELEIWMFETPQHLIRNALQIINLENKLIELDIDQSDLDCLYQPKTY